MRTSVVLKTVLFLGLPTAVAFGDSSPANPPEPVDAASASATHAEPKHEGARPATPVTGKASSAEPATPIDSTVVAAPSPTSTAHAESVSSVVTPEPVTNKPVPGKITRQSHSAYYVNRVRISLPAGIRVTVRKDWYASDVKLIYPSNPYTNWRGVTPDALAFNHTGTTLEVVTSGTKYVPTELTVIAPTPIQVEVR